jgi:hypothetical protein
MIFRHFQSRKACANRRVGLPPGRAIPITSVVIEKSPYCFGKLRKGTSRSKTTLEFQELPASV